MLTLSCKKRKTQQEILNEEIAEQLIKLGDNQSLLFKKVTVNTLRIKKNTTNIHEMDEDVRVLERIYHNKRRKINYLPNLEEEDNDSSSDYEEEEGMRLRSGRIV